MTVTLLAYDAAARQLLGEIPATTLEWHKILMAPGGVDLTVPAWDASASLLLPRRTWLLVDVDGRLDFAGWMSAEPTWSTDDDAAVLEVTSPGLWEHFRHRHYTGGWGDGTPTGGMLEGTATGNDGVTFTNVEQFDIAADLLRWTQALPGGDLHIDIAMSPPGGSGRERVRTYEPWEVKQIAEAVEQLAEVNDGFEWQVTHAWDAQQRHPIITVEFHYPRLGRDTATVLEPPQAVPVTHEGQEDWANVVLGTGSGEGSDTLFRQADEVGWPRVESVITHADVSVPATLEDHVDAELTRRSVPTAARTLLVVDPDLDVQLGDEVRVPFLDGRWPADPDTPWRVMAITTRAGEDGDIERDVDVADGSPLGRAVLPTPDRTEQAARDVLRRLGRLEHK